MSDLLAAPSCIVWGWGLAQHPYLLPPDLDYMAAAAAITLKLVLGARSARSY